MKTVLSGSNRGVKNARPCRQLAMAGLLGTTFLVGAATSVALAAVEDDDMVDISGLAAVTEESLDNLRGGFNLGPFNINFGLVIRTVINQQQVLMTSFRVETLGKIQDVKHEWQTYLHDNTPGGSPGSNSGSGSGSHTPNNPTQVQDGLSGLPGQLDGTNPPAPPSPETTQQIAEQAAQQGAQQAADAAQQAANQASNPPTNQPAGNQDSAAPNAGTPSPGNTGAGDPPDTDSAEVESPVESGGGLSVTEIPNGVIIDNGDGTAIMHQIDSGITSTIINIANGADVKHSTEMNVFIENFSQVVGQQSVFQATSSMALELARNNPLIGQ
jgi:hypothetical protein